MAEGDIEDSFFFDPSIQDSPASRSILSMLQTYTPHYTHLERELTEAEWTAFPRDEGGAMEGIVRQAYTHVDGGARVESIWVKGDYLAALSDMPSVRRDAPVSINLIKIRLTGQGERWAQTLRQGEQAGNLVKARGIVLLWIWQHGKSPAPGVAQLVHDDAPAVQGAGREAANADPGNIHIHNHITLPPVVVNVAPVPAPVVNITLPASPVTMPPVVEDNQPSEATVAMTRQDAHKKALKHVEQHGWPESARKLADAVGVSRPLLNDLPGIERYKQNKAPTAVASSGVDDVPNNDTSDPSAALAHDEERAKVLGIMDAQQQAAFNRLSTEAQKSIVDGWDDWTPEQRKSILDQCSAQAGDAAEANGPGFTKRRPKV